MNAESVIAELSSLYPGKPLKLLPEANPTEIVCEFDPPDDHPDWSLAVAVIDRSQPHFHNKTTETYHVLRGELMLHVGDEELMMFEGQHYTITAGRVHWATGNETWVEIYCTPGYSADDHHLAVLS